MDQEPGDLSQAATEVARDVAPVTGEESETDPDPDSCCNGTGTGSIMQCWSSNGGYVSATANLNGCRGSGGTCRNGVLDGGLSSYCAFCSCVSY
jgi:hypothetical protein